MDVKEMIKAKLKEVEDICEENGLSFWFRIMDERYVDVLDIRSFNDNGSHLFQEKIKDDLAWMYN